MADGFSIAVFGVVVMMAINDEITGGGADISGVDWWWWWLCCMVEVMVMLNGTNGGGLVLRSYFGIYM